VQCRARAWLASRCALTSTVSPCMPPCGSTRPQAAGAAVPLHHVAGSVRRAGAPQRRRAGGAQAQDGMARRHRALGRVADGVHATTGRACSEAPAALGQATWRAGAERQAAGDGGFDCVRIHHPTFQCQLCLLKRTAAASVRGAASGRLRVPRPSISSPHCRPPVGTFNDCSGAGRSKSRKAALSCGSWQ
jgi:hypothetical protein